MTPIFPYNLVKFFFCITKILSVYISNTTICIDDHHQRQEVVQKSQWRHLFFNCSIKMKFFQQIRFGGRAQLLLLPHITAVPLQFFVITYCLPNPFPVPPQWAKKGKKYANSLIGFSPQRIRHLRVTFVCPTNFILSNWKVSKVDRFWAQSPASGG